MEQLLECHFVDAVVSPHESTIAHPSDILRLPAYGPLGRPAPTQSPQGVQCHIAPPGMGAMSHCALSCGWAVVRLGLELRERAEHGPTGRGRGQELMEMVTEG
jgi:hypothetical protein